MTALSRVAARSWLLLALAVLVGHVRLTGRPATLCLLRATTGVPCPLCGGTTAAARLGTGDLRGALRASPLAVAAGPVVATLPVLRARLDRVPVRVRVLALVAALVLAELWQLHRFGQL